MKVSAKILILVAVTAAVAAAVVLKQNKTPTSSDTKAQTNASASGQVALGAAVTAKLPRLVDLGAGKCIPCKMMKPILDELNRDYAAQFKTDFIDVWENPDEGKKYGIKMIPTQIFYDADGRELFRHTGFFGKEDILGKWKELGVDMGGNTTAAIVHEQPVTEDTRPSYQVCFMCDGDVNAKTKALVKGKTEQRTLCSPHCYFIYFSSLVGADAKAVDAKVSVTDWASGNLIPGTMATYLYGMDAKGRPTIKGFIDKDAAAKEQQTSPGNLLIWDVLRSKELATYCGFCDRVVYPEDACKVTVEGKTHTYGCCTHCSLGVAARTGKNIEVEAFDGLTGEVIKVTTFEGSIASLEPDTATAWFGQKKTSDGHWMSAGCFKQGFFSNRDNLKKWLDAHPSMTGREITIAKALSDKMKLTPEQIAKACKVGECK